MAYARSRMTQEGRVWYVSHRVGGKVKTPTRLGVVPKSVALAAARAQTERDGTRARPEAIAPLAALGRFCDEARDIYRRSPKTIRFYQQRLAPLVRFLADKGPMRAWCRPWFEEYVRSKPHWSPRSIQAIAVGSRTFVKRLRRMGYSVGDFARDFEGPRVLRGTREAYSDEEARRILAASKGHRLELAVHLALYAGLSHGDIERFDRAAVKDGWFARPRAKTGVPVLIPVAKPLGFRIRSCAPRPLPEGSDVWRGLCELAEVPSKGGLKRLRHTFSTLLDAAGVDSATRRDLMGHTPRSVSDLYNHSDRRRLEAAIRSLETMLSPRFGVGA